MPETALIQRVTRILGPTPPGVSPIGDDASVIRQDGSPLVVSTDTLLEGTHFKRNWLSPKELGRRAAAVAVSDLAAMGASPGGGVAALNLPEDYPVRDFEDLLRGLAGAGKDWGAPVVGGNLARGRDLCLTLTVWGNVKQDPFLRTGARAGDWVFVTGTPGWAHLGLKVLGRRKVTEGPGVRQALRAWRRPVPRFDALKSLRRLKPRAVLDTSDSLAQSLEHLLGSGLDAELTVPRFPKSYVALASRLRLSPHKAWFFGGEDYQLCFAVPEAAGKKLAETGSLGGISVTQVATLSRGSGALRTSMGDALEGPDFRHFG